MHVFGLGEETGVPREKLDTYVLPLHLIHSSVKELSTDFKEFAKYLCV